MRASNVSALILSGLMTIGGPLAAQAGEKLPTVATFSILGDFVAKVGGDRVSVRTIVGPEGDAHVYQPTPADAADIAKAKVVFVNGLGFEGWMERLTKSSGYKGPIVVATTGIEPMKGEEDDDHDEHGKADAKEDHDKEHAEHGHDHGGFDPHAWQSIANAIIYVANVKDGLCKVDAAGCDSYTKNAEAYTAELKALNGEVTAMINAIPTEGRKVITSHDAFGYFGKAYGIAFLAPTGVSTESEASAQDVAKIIDQIRKEKVKALFVENITDTRLIEQISKETGVKMGGTLYSDALSKAGGPATTYVDMMRNNVKLLTGAMASS